MNPRHARDPQATRATRRQSRPVWQEIVLTVAAVVASAGLTVLGGFAVWSLLPAIGGWHVSVVMSGSMTPAVRVGDLVLSQPVRITDVHAGQVVLFRTDDGRTLVHRVEQVATDGSLITRGDANTSQDLGSVTGDELLGMARLRVPAVGLPAVWWQHHDWLPLALTLLVTAGAVAVVSTDDEDEDEDGATGDGRRGRHLTVATA